MAKISALLIYVFVAGCLSLQAQSTFGTILGTVKDSSGAAIPGASVKITNTDENTAKVLAADGN